MMDLKKYKNKRSLTLIVVIAIVVILFFTGFSIGKEMTSIKIKGSTEVAKPILVVENNPAIDVTTIENTGFYDFKVKNYNSYDEVNQIDLKYYIEIISKYDESIIFKIYKNGEEIPLKENKTEEIQLKKDTKEEQNYRLEIVYDKTKSTSTQEIVQDVQIKVHSEQVKV